VWSLIVYAIGADVGLAPLTNIWLGSKSIYQMVILSMLWALLLYVGPFGGLGTQPGLVKKESQISY